MKKTKRLAVIVAVLLLVVAAIPSPMHAESLAASSLSAQAESWYYPVLPGDEEWDAMTLEEQRTVCNMPDELLYVCSTERVLELALANPFIFSFVTIYSDVDYAINHFRRMFNIYDELFGRSDLDACVLERFKSSLSDADDSVYEKESLFTDDKLQLYALENIIGVRYYDMSVDAQKTVVETIGKVCESGDYSPFRVINVIRRKWSAIPTDLMLLKEKAEGSSRDLPTAQNVPYNAALYDSRFTPYDPSANSSYLRGYDMSSVSAGYHGSFRLYTYSSYVEDCDAWNSGDFNSTQANACDSAFRNKYPSINMTPVSTHAASLKYNCHSYAWISSSNMNKYWIDSLNSWRNAATLVSYNGYASVGDTVVLMAGNTVAHSAVVTSVGSNANNIIAKAKMGMAGVFSCSIADMMTIYGASSYYVYSV